MSFGTMRTVEDQTVEAAQFQLRAARIHLLASERYTYCCDHSRNQAVGKAKKEVKRWETWLADRDILAGEDDDDGTDDES